MKLNISVIYSKGYTMNQLAKIAINHGFMAVPFSSAVMVWDTDGSTVVNTLDALLEWMGY